VPENVGLAIAFRGARPGGYNGGVAARPRGTDMTEAEWLAGEMSFEDVLGQGFFPLSERQKLLFMTACVRQAWRLLIDDRCRHAVEAVERYADGLVPPGEVRHTWAGAWEVRVLNVAGPADIAAELVARLTPSPQTVELVARLVRSALARDYAWRQAQGLVTETGLDVEAHARAAREHLFRAIVGNPFRACQ